MQVTGKLPTSNPEQSSSKKAEPQQDFQESCHRRMHDPITGKTLTWVTTGKENKGMLSSIVAVENVSYAKFGKILKFTCQKMEDKVVESACVNVFLSWMKMRRVISGGSARAVSLNNWCHCVTSPSHS